MGVKNAEGVFISSGLRAEMFTVVHSRYNARGAGIALLTPRRVETPGRGCFDLGTLAEYPSLRVVGIHAALFLPCPLANRALHTPSH